MATVAATEPAVIPRGIKIAPPVTTVAPTKYPTYANLPTLPKFPIIDKPFEINLEKV